MGRRRRVFGIAELPTTLGKDFDAVCTKITEKIMDTVALMHPCPVTVREIADHCVAPEVRNLMVEAKRYKAEAYDRTKVGVSMGSYGKFLDIELNCMVPKEEYIRLPDEMQRALEPWYAELLKVYREWMVVRYVASWFNRHASTGAMRYYWPCLMSLMPPGRNLDNMHKGTLEKYKEPLGISKMLPLCRTTATLVTAGQMLPARDPVLHGSPLIFQIIGHTHVIEDYTGGQHTIEGVPVMFHL